MLARFRDTIGLCLLLLPLLTIYVVGCVSEAPNSVPLDGEMPPTLLPASTPTPLAAGPTPRSVSAPIAAPTLAPTTDTPAAPGSTEMDGNRPASFPTSTPAPWPTSPPAHLPGMVSLAQGNSHGFVSVTAGYANTCGLRTDGSIVCWGYNRYGQATTPDGSFIALDSGGNKTCGVRTDGRVICWGAGIDGLLSPLEGDFVSVSVGTHVCGVTSGGRIKCAGEYANGETPPGEYRSVSVGVWQSCGLRIGYTLTCWETGYASISRSPVDTPPPGETFGAVSVGLNHTCGILQSNGSVACWGNYADHLNHDYVTPPSGAFRAVSAGNRFTCGIRAESRTVECWGRNINDYLRFLGQTTPPDGVFVSVSAGNNHACGVREDSSILCWGENDWGQSNPPGKTPFMDPPEIAFKAVGVGDYHTCGIRTDGRVECWGSNLSEFEFTGQAIPPAGAFTAVSAGLAHTCALRDDGTVACWGGSSMPSGSLSGPVLAYGEVDATIGTFIGLSAGFLNACGVRTDHSVECWGMLRLFADIEGDADMWTPPAGKYVSVSVGAWHACGLRTDGTVACWGANEGWDTGPLGQAMAPEGIFHAVSAGSLHTCGLGSDGNLVCWGAVSGEYELVCYEPSDGDTACWYDAPELLREHEEITAGQLPEGVPIVLISGDAYTCALPRGHALYCMNSVAPDGAFISASAGRNHACGIRPDGRAVCWGDNQYGQSSPPR